MRRILGLLVLLLAVLALTSCGGGGGGGTGGGGGGGSNLAKLSVAAAFAPATRIVPGYADELHVSVTPPTGVSLPANTPSEFTLTRAASARDLVGLTPSAAPYTFNMEALTDGVVVGRVVRTIIVTPGMDEGIDVSAFLQSEIASIQIEGPTSMLMGDNIQFTAHARNSQGQSLFSGAGFTWTSTDPLVLYVDVDTGIAIPRIPGTETLKATLTGTAKSGTLQVTVQGDVNVSVSPSVTTAMVLTQMQFSATVTGTQNTSVNWSVDEANGGSITAGGLYTAPGQTGTYHVRATSQVFPSATGIATVTVGREPGWTIINLHPNGAKSSTASGISGDQQVGSATFEDKPRACIWTGSAESMVDLTLTEMAEALAVDNGVQGGYAYSVDHLEATIWSGTAASFVSLHPANASTSQLYGVSGSKQVGYATLSGIRNAGIWSGSAASWVSLHPTAATNSCAYGVHGGQQVGFAEIGLEFRASLWTGSSLSRVDLTPLGAQSAVAFGVFDGQQVGYAEFGTGKHAGLWTGNAASWVDLLPPGSTNSVALGVHAGEQVGYVTVFSKDRATLWRGTAESRVDLHSHLPSNFSRSSAKGIWHNAFATYVVGEAFNATANRTEAIMWIGPAPG